MMVNYNSPSHKIKKETELLIIEDYNNNNIRVKDIAIKYSIHESTITNIIKRNNIPYVSNRSRSLLWNDPNHEQIIIDTWKECKSIKDVANKFNIGTNSVSKILNKHNIYYKSKIILTEEQKERIIVLFEQNNTLASIKKEMNICCNILSKFLRELGYNTSKKSKLEGYDKYYSDVRNITSKQYSLYKEIINPNNYKKGKIDYHIDHIYSIYDGYINGIDPNILGHYSNLRMLHYLENIQKGKRSDKDITQLMEDYNKEIKMNTSH